MYLPIKAVLFDFDGVLVHSPLDLAAIKYELFGDANVYIIEGLEAMEAGEREIKTAILNQRELEAARDAYLDPGVPDLFKWMENRDLARGVITRNTREVVEFISKKHDIDFGVVIAREDAPPKPDPASVLAACEIIGVKPEECVMVGDFKFDIEAGNSAGCRTVFLETEQFAHLEPGEDAKINNLKELTDLLEEWIEIY